jgi:hypothetical protein
MKRKLFISIFASAILLLGGGGNSNAQIKKVQMYIGGYLCGN